MNLIINFATDNTQIMNRHRHIRITRNSLLGCLLILIATLAFTSCNDSETYADQVKRERSAISSYIAKNNIKVISEDQFREQGETTDTTKNEFVLFESSGLYMQIRSKGTGKVIGSGQSASLLCRYTERNLLTDSIQVSNTINAYYYRYVEKLNVTNNSGTFTGSFDTSTSLMYLFYSTTSVPSGWLAVLPYIKPGRYAEETDTLPKVRIIVPHDLGQTYATQSVYPCLYDITFQRGI